MNKIKDDIKPWKVVKSKLLIDCKPWLTVHEESLELPNGNRLDGYYTLDYPDWINVIAITNDGEFIIERQYRHGIGEVNFELCAGTCEDYDTDPLDCAKRELLEETGYAGGEWSLYMQTSANPGTHTNRVHCFIAKGVEKVSEPNLEDTEDISVHLMTLHEVKQLLMDNEVKQAVMAAPLWKYIAEYDK